MFSDILNHVKFLFWIGVLKNTTNIINETFCSHNYWIWNFILFKTNLLNKLKTIKLLGVSDDGAAVGPDHLNLTHSLPLLRLRERKPRIVFGGFPVWRQLAARFTSQQRHVVVVVVLTAGWRLQQGGSFPLNLEPDWTDDAWKKCHVT